MNASWQLVSRMLRPARQMFVGYKIEARLLPTEWEQAPIHLVEHLIAEQPVLALHFGVSKLAKGFEIETRAVNARQTSADAAGAVPEKACVTAEAPEHLPATWPASHIVTHLRRDGIPVKRSRDAGRYLCNTVLFESLQFARATGWPARVGFVHIPASLADVRPNSRYVSLPSRSPMDWGQAVQGGLAIVEASVRSLSGRGRHSAAA